MRIGYFIPPSLLAHEGIAARVRGTLAAWSALGHEGILLTSPMIPGRLLLPDHIREDRASAARAADLASKGSIDGVHIRLLLPTHAWSRTLGDLPVSLEVHAGLRHPENARDAVRVLLGYPAASALTRRASSAVFVTAEMAEYSEFRNVANRVAIGNGTRLGDPTPPPGNDRLRVGMAVGSPAKWQGLDRFADLADRNPDMDFTVLCQSRHRAAIARSLTGTTVRLTLCADLAAYKEALAGLDAAVGSLAIERKGLSEAAPLKVRDYLNAGIPTALSYRDTNLSGLGDPAILEFDHSDVDSFRRWALNQSGKRVAFRSRSAISIESVEARRLEAITASW